MGYFEHCLREAEIDNEARHDPTCDVQLQEVGSADPSKPTSEGAAGTGRWHSRVNAHNLRVTAFLRRSFEHPARTTAESWSVAGAVFHPVRAETGSAHRIHPAVLQVRGPVDGK